MREEEDEDGDIEMSRFLRQSHFGGHILKINQLFTNSLNENAIELSEVHMQECTMSRMCMHDVQRLRMVCVARLLLS